MSERPPATRQVLLRTRRQLDRMQKGTTMLRRKREALVAELFQLARPAASARQAIASEATKAYGSLLEAYAREGHAGLRAWAWPSRELTVEIRPLSVWGVPASAITDAPTVARTAASRGTPPGPARAALLETAEHFERLVDRLVTSAPRELLLQRLGQALSSTTRQVNVLEQRLAPGLARQLMDVRRRLEEREREEHGRLQRLSTRSTQPGHP